MRRVPRPWFVRVGSFFWFWGAPIPKNLKELRYGVSLTDSCIGWETTERMLRWGYETLGKLQEHEEVRS